MNMAENDPPREDASVHEPHTVEIKATWSPLGQLDPVLVDHLHLQHIADCYYLIFGQSNFPLMIGDMTKGVESQIKTVVRLALTPESFAKIKAIIERAK